MVISIIQPCFIPWQGYFEQIAIADLFVYMDDVQYTKKDWRNRNKLISPSGIINVHVPVQKTTRETLINQTLISYNEPWQDRLKNQIIQWYKKAPYFNEVLPILEKNLFNSNFEKLVDLNCHLNQDILNYMKIDTPIRLTSEVPRVNSDKNSRIVEICKYFEGTLLYDGKKAEDFINKELFASSGIEIVFQDYQHTPYKQLWNNKFEPYISIVDLIMNAGASKSKEIIFSSRMLNSKLQEKKNEKLSSLRA